MTKISQNCPMPYGVDSSFAQVTQKRLDFLVKECGALPQWWARYLGDPKDPITLNAEKESPLLQAAGVPLVTIARRSGVVSLGSDRGQQCGAEDAKQLAAIAAKYPVNSKVFLDVEMTPVLSAFFWKAWAIEIARAGFEPCVYLPNAVYHRPQWEALNTAILRGAPCAGIWVAGYFYQSNDECNKGTSTYKEILWDKRLTSGPATAPVLAWQYIGNAYGKQFDFNALSPDVDIWW
jgi:hypothetical protein